ncbi:MAG TPA: carboxypeptidase-like regulatory domain-containing protein, partial [Puia sp.]|nr:carboxypeptidase-like regulatory domain-containing protein [Puia sp.]
MKLSAVLLLAASLQVRATTAFSQSVTWSGREVPMTKVLTAVEQQTSFVFFFNYDLLQQAHAVSMEARNMPLREFLDQLLVDQPLTYTIHNKTIVLSARTLSSPVIGTAGLPQPTTELHGRIVNENGEPVSGASITIRGTRRGTTSDLRGEFSLKDIPENAVLVISYIGFNNQEIRVGENREIRITLVAAENTLDQTVIIGYGKTSKRLNTGSVSTISSETISQQPVTDPLAALQGRAPGLYITASNGLPGSDYQVRIRGENSIKQGNDPLYI